MFSLCFSKLDLFQLQRTLNKSVINGLTAYQTLVAGGCGYACQAHITIALLHIKDTGTPCEALLEVFFFDRFHHHFHYPCDISFELILRNRSNQF